MVSFKATYLYFISREQNQSPPQRHNQTFLTTQLSILYAKSSKFQHHRINRMSKFWILAIGNTFAKCCAFFIGFEWKVHMKWIISITVGFIYLFIYLFILSLEQEIGMLLQPINQRGKILFDEWKVKWSEPWFVFASACLQINNLSWK